MREGCARSTGFVLRGGVTTLFAALNTTAGEVIGSLHRRHRDVEFGNFLVELDKEVPADPDVHLICDKYATHKIPASQKWRWHTREHLVEESRTWPLLEASEAPADDNIFVAPTWIDGRCDFVNDWTLPVILSFSIATLPVPEQPRRT